MKTNIAARLGKEWKTGRIGRSLIVGLTLLGAFASASAYGSSKIDASEEGAYLDPPYPRYGRINSGAEAELAFENSKPRTTRDVRHRNIPLKSDTLAVIAQQTPIRNQSARGTCSIFSAIALAEAQLLKLGQVDSTADFSEEWLQYTVMSTKRPSHTGEVEDGSWTSYNFQMFQAYGVVEEPLMPYIGETWKALDSSPLALLRCSLLQNLDLSRCLLGHRNPNLLFASDEDLRGPQSAVRDLEFLAARERAYELRGQYFGSLSRSGHQVWRLEEAKALLAQGEALILDLDFFYGAWNHRKAEELNIGRDLEAWRRGEVGFPEVGSADRARSHQEPAGHSIVIVGYDDEAVIETEVLMEDGTREKFSYTGVLYFKNSWGTSQFGAETRIEGVRAPGYGVISQKYAWTYGQLFRLRLK